MQVITSARHAQSTLVPRSIEIVVVVFDVGGCPPAAAAAAADAFFKCELWLLMLLLLSSGTELILSWLMSTTVSKLGDLVVVKIVEEAR